MPTTTSVQRGNWTMQRADAAYEERSREALQTYRERFEQR